MAILKCKMCGGDLVLRPDCAIAECEYCGTVQTIPAADNEKMLALFSRAHRLRAQCEFDKAAGIYESITLDFPEEAEAYWGLILCKYGIEYVDDPKTGNKVPTCHRSSFDSVFSDRDLEQTLRYAQEDARPLYRQEAEEIESLRKNIIAVSSHEDPYDIFICYKETDRKGRRSLDSVLAQDVYEALTARGYRVFFSRISLEEVIGQEYEPYIFAALHSARVMLVFATDPRHMDAVWVKNEWSRFLSLMEKGEQKYLIPCYKGIDIKDLPTEFTRLQAQDLGKVGAIQDLIRGIDKLTGRASSRSVETLPEENRKKTVSRTGLRIGILAAAVLVVTFLWLGRNRPAETPQTLYNKAAQSLLDRDYKQAETHLQKLAEAGEAPEQLAQVYLDHVLNQLLKEDADSNSSTEAVKQYQKFLLTLQNLGTAPSTLADMQHNTLTQQYQILLSEQQYEKIPFLQETLGDPENIPDEVRQAQYATAKNLLKDKKAEEAIAIFSELGAYLDSGDQLRLAQAELVHSQASAYEAAMAYYAIRDIPGAWERCMEIWAEITGRSAVAVSQDYVAVVNRDGSAADYDMSHNITDTERIRNFSDLVSISAGVAHTVGLRKDGTVVAARLSQPQYQQNQCYVSHWSDVVAIAANEHHTMGLRADGTVFATGAVTAGPGNSFYDVSGWKEILAISAGSNHAVGLKKDGTVVAAGRNTEGQCDVSHWKDITAIAAGYCHTAGLKKDGTVVIAGSTGDGRSDVSQWRDIVAIASGKNHIAGLKQDGTVVLAGLNTRQRHLTGKELVAIAAGGDASFALQADGTLVWDTSLNSKNIPQWNNIYIPGK